MNNYGVKIFDTLLKELDERDFDTLISQEKLRAKGYEIHFVIDPDLIQNYCYPRGIFEETKRTERLSKLTDEYIADEQVTLHSIFNLIAGNEKILFFNQYSPELKGMIYTATRYGKKLEYDLDIPEYNMKIGQSEFKEMLYNYFSRIVANVLINVNGLKKISNLFNQQLLSFEARGSKNDTIIRCLESYREDDKREKVIVDIWKRVIKQKLYPSKRRDAIIFDKVISINNYVQEVFNFDNHKPLFILLTDSSMAKALFKSFVDGPTSVLYPKYFGENISLIRNVPQTFAYLISIVYKDNNQIDVSETIENLERLKQVSKAVSSSLRKTERLIEKNNPRQQNVDLFASDVYGQIFDNYRQLRNAFENTGLLKSFDGLYNSIKNEISALDLEQIKLLFTRIKKEIKVLTSELDSEHAEYLNRVEKEAIFTTTFINGVERIKNLASQFEISKGDDFVEGSYHHLPIFLVFPLDEQYDYRKSMNRLMLLILNREVGESSMVYKEIEAFIESMRNSKIDSIKHYEINLIKAFIFMILPSEVESQNDDNNLTSRKNDFMAFEWLQLLSKMQIHNEELNADLQYMLCWAARRIGKYEESLQYAKNGIESYPFDPRFYHGKALSEYCIYEKGVAIGDSTHFINEILEDLKMTHKLYGIFIQTKFIEFDTGLMLSKITDTFSNSYCYCLVLKAYIMDSQKANPDKVSAILIEARENLERLKTLSQYREELPEYYDTESHLEYLESFYTERKWDKIKCAEIAIGIAINLTNNKSLKQKYLNHQRKIRMRIQSLKNQH